MYKYKVPSNDRNSLDVPYVSSANNNNQNLPQTNSVPKKSKQSKSSHGANQNNKNIPGVIGCYEVINYHNKSGELCTLRPSEEQLRIITSDMHQDQKIIACAGSGKTTTLVARLKYLVDSGVDPASIIVSTFNVEAGRHIYNRAKELLGEKEVKFIEIGNIDKIAFRLYSEFIKEKQSIQAKQFGLSVKEYCFELFKFLQTKEGIKYVLDKYKYFFFDEFQDVNQLQYDILMLFKKHGCYLIVIGDDAQNIYGWRDSQIDIIQTRIDNDIKRFQGSSIKTYMLSTNFRCSKPITLFSNMIIAGSTNLIQKSMKHQDRLIPIQKQTNNLNNDSTITSITTDSNNDSTSTSINGESMDIENPKPAEEQQYQEEYKPYLQCYKGMYNQNDEIIGQIKLKLKNYKLCEIAILCPTNQPLKFFEEALEKHNQKNENSQLLYVSLIGNGSSSSENAAYTQQLRQIAIEKKLDRITLSTIHRAKGLEWKVVFFIGVNDEYFPTNFIRDPHQSLTRLEECRRLFYVGCTRAINELYFSMTKTAKCHKVCRFFADISDDLFEKDLDIVGTDINFDTEQIEKEYEKDINVIKIIEEMDHKDFSEVQRFLIGLREAEQITLHTKCDSNEKELKHHNLYADLTIFIDLYIQRLLGEQLKAENAYQCEYAKKVLFSLCWKNEKADIIIKYSDFFNSKQLSFEEMETSKDFVNAFHFFHQFKPHEDESEEDSNTRCPVTSQILEEMYGAIKTFKEVNKISYSMIQHISVDETNSQIKEYFPEDFDRKYFISGFNNFMNQQVLTNSMIFDIYQVSKCQQLLDMARKVLYRNDLTLINPNNMVENISKFIIYLKKFNYSRLRVKHQIMNGTLLKGEISLIADDTIYEIKASQYKYISKEYILQVLAYAAMIKASEGIDIRFISFYNPLIGVIHMYNLEKWPFAQDYLQFLIQKSCKQNEIKKGGSGDNSKNTKVWHPNGESLIGSVEQTIQMEKSQVKANPFNIAQFSQPVQRPKTQQTEGGNNVQKNSNTYKEHRNYVKTESMALQKQQGLQGVDKNNKRSQEESLSLNKRHLDQEEDESKENPKKKRKEMNQSFQQ